MTPTDQNGPADGFTVKVAAYDDLEAVLSLRMALVLEESTRFPKARPHTNTESIEFLSGTIDMIRRGGVAVAYQGKTPVGYLAILRQPLFGFDLSTTSVVGAYIVPELRNSLVFKRLFDTLYTGFETGNLQICVGSGNAYMEALCRKRGEPIATIYQIGGEDEHGN